LRAQIYFYLEKKRTAAASINNKFCCCFLMKWLGDDYTEIFFISGCFFLINGLGLGEVAD
jgi:hypothetical protein